MVESFFQSFPSRFYQIASRRWKCHGQRDEAGARHTGRSDAPMQYAVFHLRCHSLLRGTLLVLASLFAAIAASGFPNLRPSLWMVLPALGALYGTWETTRCLRRRWSFYHGGVLLLLYADVLILTLIVFLLLYPWALRLQRP
jgi:hypothetical protein